MIFNGVTITPGTIERTRKHFADLCRACIAEAESGERPVNDLPAYEAWQCESIARVMAGGDDHTLTFMQRAYWLQTGDCPALLP